MFSSFVPTLGFVTKFVENLAEYGKLFFLYEFFILVG